MTVGHYLRGRPRANPGPYLLVHRHAEGGAWREVDRAASPELLADAVRAGTVGWRVDVSAGDLVRAVGPEGGVLYGVGTDGGLVPLPDARPSWDLFDREPAARREPDWARAWEASHHARSMIWAARVAVPRRARVAAAAACVRLLLPHLGPLEAQVREGVDAAEALARGARTAASVRRLRTRLAAVAENALYGDAPEGVVPGAAFMAASAARELLAAAAAPPRDRVEAADKLATAAEDAQSALWEVYGEAPEALAQGARVAATVRTSIPTAAIVLGLLDPGALEADP